MRQELTMARTTNAVTRFFVEQRRWIQGVLGIGVYALMSTLGVGLWWILATGAITGIIFGKVFCRWACPIGFIMEIVTGLGGPESKFQGMYQYHKIGCPIAWISGALNKYSLFKVRSDKAACTSCGLCDKACYLATLEPATYSLFKNNKERPGEAHACSKCLVCITACPTGSLSYKVGMKR
jgi:polyferredoxin